MYTYMYRDGPLSSGYKSPCIAVASGHVADAQSRRWPRCRRSCPRSRRRRSRCREMACAAHQRWVPGQRREVDMVSICLFI